jgi:hypothetical protein
MPELELDPTKPIGADVWLRRLHSTTVNRRHRFDRLARYYDGDHNLGFASKKFLDSFGGLFNAFADNWVALIVDAVEERLDVNGFRAPGASKPSDAAHAIWQANELDAASQVAHTESLLNGTAFGLAWYGENDGEVDITVEHPAWCAVAVDPRRPRRRLAGLRLYRDEWGYRHGELFLPDTVHFYRSPEPTADDELVSDVASLRWVRDVKAARATNDLDAGVAEGYVANPLGVVPIVELPNRPRLKLAKGLDVWARSEVASVIPLQDAVNKLVADMLVSSEFAAYPQRYATGFEVERDPKTNQAVNPFRPGQDVWWMEDAEGRFGTFEVSDLGNFVKAIELLVLHIASITRTPPHYLNGSADRLSGESIKAAESGLVAKTRRKMRHYGEAWEELVRIGGRITGDAELVAANSLEVIWRDPESRTESEHVDATIKLKGLALPDEYLWERVGLTPTEIARVKSLRMDEAIERELTGPMALEAGDGAPAGPAMDPAAIKAAADAMGVLIRAGVRPEDAAARAGLAGVRFTGAVPTSLRLPETEAEGLESAGGA